jgi:DNA-binding transcriptional LysR family regulator
MVGIVPPQHRFAGRKSLPLAEFLSGPLIGGEPGTGTGRLLAEALGARAATPAVVLQMGLTEGVKRAVAAGLGVSIVLACAVRDEVAAGTLVPVAFSDARLVRQGEGLDRSSRAGVASPVLPYRPWVFSPCRPPQRRVASLIRA